MGTNYYLREKPPCESCGHEPERLHIGKSSAGWVFALHVYPEDGIRDLDDWVDRWQKADAAIFDEYGKHVPPGDMMLIIMARVRPNKGEPVSEEWLRDNQAVRGPFGLARARPDGKRVLGAGNGTYDRHTGDFS